MKDNTEQTRKQVSEENPVVQNMKYKDYVKQVTP